VVRAFQDRDEQHELTLILVEFKVALARYLGTRDSEVKTRRAPLEDVIAFNRVHAEQELPRFVLTELDGVLGEHELDALVAPSTAPAARSTW
jgi:hypothetical protein